ncbi:MAG: (2Fe-2S)-binding protein [Deltaproteobacteria bacterium]|nr:(2Fe-2S)-binding protein [Deltaproteobacteria bacterium]
MARVTILIDGREVSADAGQPLLWAALDAGIHIPNLCAIRDEFPDGNCRLCFVGLEGRAEPVLSCAVRPKDGMVVRAATPELAALRRTGFELLLGAHAPTCHGCAALKSCELIKIAKREKWPLRSKRFALRPITTPADGRHSAIRLEPDKCVWCKRCIVECRRVRPEDPLLEFAHRGPRAVLSTFQGDPLPESCAGCLRCVEVCPTAGLNRKP